MRLPLRWLWIVGLVVIPLVAIAGLVFRHTTAAAPEVDLPGSVTITEGREAFRPYWGRPESLTKPPEPVRIGGQAWIDYRSMDASRLDLSGQGALLTASAWFDTRTVWPASLPPEFKPDRLMELGKDPGLGIRGLHREGVTGAGVRVAVLDIALWLDHPEYQGKVINYYAAGAQPAQGGFSALSVLAGETTGVAPGVQVTYYATQFAADQARGARTFLPMAAAINKILDDNRRLAKADRVRVICAPIGADVSEEGYEALRQAYRRAKDEGVLIATNDMVTLYPYAIYGLGRKPYADPNDLAAYGLGSFWADAWAANGGSTAKWLFVPMDARTVSGMTTPNFAYYPGLGLGMAVAWGAGMYALVAQVDPKVTPEEFLEVAYKTGDYITVNRDGKEFRLGPIINPSRVIEYFKQ
ncbi:MAG TPA: hypothetical protein VD969_00585 [Symbiobacteriaceae bacterium]|nr:hypothetical protein [Symbiobacteriaceae bacterium]